MAAHDAAMWIVTGLLLAAAALNVISIIRNRRK